MIRIRNIWPLLVLSFLATASPAVEPTEPWGPLVLLDRKVAPGEKLKFSYAQTPSFEASYLNTVVFASRGRKPGPTL